MICTYKNGAHVYKKLYLKTLDQHFKKVHRESNIMYTYVGTNAKNAGKICMYYLHRYVNSNYFK